MASVSGRKASPTMSILQGSDEDMPVCMPCERGGRSLEAEGFCRTCNEHLCQACYDSHLLPKPLAHHVLLDKSMMPREVPPPEDMCTEHPNQQLEYYCRNCNTLECSKCVNIHHRKCDHVSYIQDICDDIEETEEFKTLYRTLTCIENDLVQNKAKATTNLTNIQTNVNEIKTIIHGYRKYLDEQLDKMEEALCEEADELGENDNEAMANVSKECDVLTSSVRSVIYSLDVSRKVQQKLLLFITMKNTERIIANWQSTLEGIVSKNKIRSYEFKPVTQLQNFIEDGQSLGRLLMEGDADQPSDLGIARDIGDEVDEVDDHVTETVENQSPERGIVGMGPEQSESERTGTRQKRPQNTLHSITATRKERINVRTELDVIDCSINGSVVIDSTHLAVTDSMNSAVKMVDLNQKKVIDRLSLKHPPFDITRIDNDSLAVTCPDGKYIQLVRVSKSGTLTLDQYIITEIPLYKSCYGIHSFSGARLVGSFTDPDKVSIMDMIGTGLQDISAANHCSLSSSAANHCSLSRPYHITITKDEIALIVSNSGNDSVTKLTTDGSYVFAYHDSMLQFPRGVAVGDRGEVYVCGGLSSNIHVISSEGRKIKVLLEQTDGVKNPESITYAENKLFVGSNNNNCVDVYWLGDIY